MESDNTIIHASTSLPNIGCVTDDWRKAMLSVETVYADAPIVLRVNGVRAGTLGNFSASIGKAKSKKSFNATAMAAAALCSDYVLGYDVILPPDKSTILYVDTEQSCGDCQLLMRRILTLAGHEPDTDHPDLVFLSLRQYTPEERIRLISEAMASLPTVGLVIIDGVRDLLHDINNPTEATSVISLLMRWPDRYQFHLYTVLYQNKSDDNARGHLGTELVNKAETVMSVEKDKEDGAVSVVRRPVYTRSTEFHSFAFRIAGGELALPEIVGDYSFLEPAAARSSKGKFSPFDLGEENHRRALSKIFPDQTVTYSYSELTKEIKSAYGDVLGHTVGDNAVSKIIQFLRNKRMVVQDDNRKGAPYRFNPDFVW